MSNSGGGPGGTFKEILRKNLTIFMLFNGKSVIFPSKCWIVPSGIAEIPPGKKYLIQRWQCISQFLLRSGKVMDFFY